MVALDNYPRHIAEPMLTLAVKNLREREQGKGALRFWREEVRALPRYAVMARAFPDSISFKEHFRVWSNPGPVAAALFKTCEEVRIVDAVSDVIVGSYRRGL